MKWGCSDPISDINVQNLLHAVVLVLSKAHLEIEGFRVWRAQVGYIPLSAKARPELDPHLATQTCLWDRSLHGIPCSCAYLIRENV